MVLCAHRIEIIRSLCVPGYTALENWIPCYSWVQCMPLPARGNRPSGFSGYPCGFSNADIKAVVSMQKGRGGRLSLFLIPYGRGPPSFCFRSELRMKGVIAMWQKNDGKGEVNILQNQFTAYLITALHRKKSEYMKHKNKLDSCELPLDIQEDHPILKIEPDMVENLPLLLRLENDDLLQALQQIKERDRYIFLAKVLDSRDFESLAKELGISYKGVAAAYYRVVQRIKNKMKEMEK